MGLGWRMAFRSLKILAAALLAPPRAVLSFRAGTGPHRSLGTTGAAPKMMAAEAAGLQVVTLDATGTFMQLKEDTGRQYLDVLETHLEDPDVALRGVTADGVAAAFMAGIRERCKTLPCFGAGVMSSEDWWKGVVTEAFVGAGVSEEVLDPVIDSVFDELFHEVFTGEQGWELVPGARNVLEDLKAWRNGGGPRALGVVSNFDERLHPLLRTLGVHDAFDFIITSREAGVEKPSPRIFSKALAHAGLGEGSAGVHVGDTWKNDVVGARAAGWKAVLIATGEPTEQEREVEHVRVERFTDVPSVLRMVG